MKMARFYYTIASTAIAAIITAGPAAAQDQESGTAGEVPRFIQRFDQDGDGRVSAEEFPTRFQFLDNNDDGFIDATEAPVPPPRGKRRKGPLFPRFDTDGDGKLSLEEFPGPDDRFGQMDTDGDGFLSKAEAAAGKRRGGPGRDDSDGDGRVSKAEFSGSDEVFDQLDANGDGFIDRGEIRRGRHGKRCPGDPEAALQ